jgi:hypothetical protein
MAGSRYPNGISANSTAPSAGEVRGDTIVGALTGDVTGNITGNVVGGIQTPVGTVADGGTAAVPTTGSQVIALVKAAAGTITLTAPTATTDDGKAYIITATTAAAHVVLAGTVGFNAGGTVTDTATLGGAKGDGFTVFAYQGAWYLTSNINATLS